MKNMNTTANGGRRKPLEASAYTMETVHSSMILTSPYQREFDERKVKRIVDNFDERIANEPKLSYRDGNYYVFDGQHTIAARKAKNFARADEIRNELLEKGIILKDTREGVQWKRA